MGKNVLVILFTILILILSGYYFYTKNKIQNSQNNSQIEDPSLEVPEKEMLEKNSFQKTESSDQANVMKSDSRYVDYSKQKFDLYKDKKRVLYFHATWCPDCQRYNKEFLNNLDKIPKDVVLFRTDYDMEKDLKQKYNIVYQHTYILVDSEGNEIKKWNGGGIEQLISQTK